MNRETLRLSVRIEKHKLAVACIKIGMIRSDYVSITTDPMNRKDEYNLTIDCELEDIQAIDEIEIIGIDIKRVVH